VNPPAGVKAIRNAVNSVKRYNLIGCVTHEQNAPRIIFMKGPQVFHEVILNSLAPFSSQKRKDFLSACHEQPCAPPVSKMNGGAKSACKRCGHLRGHTILHFDNVSFLVGRLLSPAPCDRVNVNT
jgi:hypothetical protein